MTLTTTQARTAQALVNVFETGHPLGDYGQVTVIEGDSGHLSFGRAQTTLGSGSLHGLIARYTANPGARFGPRLAAWLPALTARDTSLDHDAVLHNLLRATADDPVMRETQDAVFDAGWWQPALRAAARLGLTSPLAAAVVYDSHVHGNWTRLRDRTTALQGTPTALGERAWIAAYVATRRRWLATHPRLDLRPTVYRMDAFQRLIEHGFWGLALPLVVRGMEISAATLNGPPPGCYDGPLPGSRALGVQSPLARGLDVRLLQLGLSTRGVDVRADGVFGQASARVVAAWQRRQGLPATGIADVALIAALVDDTVA